MSQVQQPEVSHLIHIWQGIRLGSMRMCASTYISMCQKTCRFLLASKATLCNAPIEPSIFLELFPGWEMERLLDGLFHLMVCNKVHSGDPGPVKHQSQLDPLQPESQTGTQGPNPVQSAQVGSFRTAACS